MYNQLVYPDLNVDVIPGWCLKAVQDAFGAPVIEPTATSAWEHCQFKHYDMNFPDGCYVIAWFSLAYEPAGHVVIIAPDKSVYSTSSSTSNKFTHHNSIEDLIAYYGDAGLTFLGWSEDIETLRVVIKEEQEVIEIQPPVFNKDYYVANNQDIIKSDIDPVSHWIQYGIAEGRKSCPNFHVQEYLENYPDLQAVYDKDFHAALLHYFNFGINEFRFGTKEAKEKYESLSKPITPTDCPQSATDIEKDTNNKVNKIWSFLTGIFAKKD